jgi:CheY-like chemotaxis protein
VARVRTSLRQHGATRSSFSQRVEVVADGGEALHALAARHHDAVLMDCQMPGMDG